MIIFSKKKVVKAINTIEASTCVNFSFASQTTQDYIAIVRKPSGSECSSAIGKIGRCGLTYKFLGDILSIKYQNPHQVP